MNHCFHKMLIKFYAKKLVLDAPRAYSKPFTSSMNKILRNKYKRNITDVKVMWSEMCSGVGRELSTHI